jgi:tetratricopeptide (TPR) repeat protein
VALCILAVVRVPRAHGEERPEVLLSEAETLLKEKEYGKALAAFEKVIVMGLDSARAYRGLVQCHLGLEDPQGAVVFMETRYLEDPDRAEVCYGLGYSLYHIKKYKEAKTYFEKAVELKPDLAEAWNNRGVIYHFVDRDYDKARQCYEKAIAVSRKTANAEVLKIAQENLSHLPVPVVLKPFRDSLTFEAFVNQFITRVDANDRIAVQELVLGQKDHCPKAMEWFLEKAVRSWGEGQKEEEQRAVLLARILEKAYREAFDSTALKGKLDHYERLSDEKKRDFVSGERLFEQGLQKEQKGLYDGAETDYKGALAHFEAAGDTKRKGYALICLGDVYRKMGKHDLAHEAYGTGLRHLDDPAESGKKAAVLSSLGITSYHLGRKREALSYFSRSLELYRQLRDDEAAGKVQQNIDVVKTRLNE